LTLQCARFAIKCPNQARQQQGDQGPFRQAPAP
jgi:hypothetical protein